ncbi:SMI1/KNR4 family protein [Fodinicola acaciae]|uniref:SMI1/KNR4 family protein n=1 Tax=Fodinicola acaciae TaxID=2681555 RepID=UPI0013D5D7ED|nr:SMI1/KNR4 family protein [Fodinicola acaciae]
MSELVEFGDFAQVEVLLRAGIKLKFELLALANGFYAFESALHVFPSGLGGDHINIETWNGPDLWRGLFQGMADHILFFAEDIFGEQFGIKNNKICSFNPETGETEEIASSLEEWAESILADYNMMTGYSLGSEWQRVNGSLPFNQRLLPKIPFILNGITQSKTSTQWTQWKACDSAVQSRHRSATFLTAAESG